MFKYFSQLSFWHNANDIKKIEVPVSKSISHYNWFARYDNRTNNEHQYNSTKAMATKSEWASS